MQRIFDAALAMLYPSACRVCGAAIEAWRDGVACAPCWKAWDDARRTLDGCEKCGMPLPAWARDRRCGECEPLAFAEARACGPYRGALRETVLWLKKHPQLPPRAREELRAAFERLRDAPAIDAVLPVPLHPARAAERSFNQAEILAEALARDAGLRVDAASLTRVRHAERHRAGMPARDRLRSMKNAFRVRAPRLVEGRRLLLVDDVMTTGSTAHEAARALLAAGAHSVRVLALARALPEFRH